MPSQTSDPPLPDNAAVLRIVAGLHAGATRPLGRREMVLIGSGDDCDVVLADPGVAAHHALLNVVDGRFHLRALDAPVELPGHTLHPGDPVEVSQVQRIGVGMAAIAFGRADAAEWMLLSPEFGLEAPAQAPKRPFARRMPAIAGVAVLALAGLAIFAALTPASAPPVDVERRLGEIATENGVSDAQVTRDVEGRAVLSGTVDGRVVRDRIAAQVAREALPATLSLRSGEDLAADVAEVMRTGGYRVQAEYLGGNNVRVTGNFGPDEQALRAFILSRAMVETGVNRVEPVNLDAVVDAVADAGTPRQDTRAHIVSIVRGDTPYIVDADGNRYVDGAEVPGWGRLVSIGQAAHVLQEDGTLVKLTPSPPPPPPEPPADDAGEPDAAPARQGRGAAGAVAAGIHKTEAGAQPRGGAAR